MTTPMCRSLLRALKLFELLTLPVLNIKGNCRGTNNNTEKAQKWIADRENKALPRRQNKKK